MKNTYKIVWSEEALNGLKEIISYLESKFSEKEIKNFAKKLIKWNTWVLVYAKELNLKL